MPRSYSLPPLLTFQLLPRLLRFLFCLSAISGTLSTNPLVNRIRILLCTLATFPAVIALTWVPSYRRIRDNEKIDAAAESTTHLPPHLLTHLSHKI